MSAPRTSQKLASERINLVSQKIDASRPEKLTKGGKCRKDFAACQSGVEDGASAASVCSLLLSSPALGSRGRNLGTINDTSMIRVTPANIRVYPTMA